MSFYDSNGLGNEQILNFTASSQGSHEITSENDYKSYSTFSPINNAKNIPNFNLTSSSKFSTNDINVNDPLATVSLMKEKLKKLERISHSENYNENILNEINTSIMNTPSGTTTPSKSRKVKLLVTKLTQTESDELYSFSEEHLDLFQEIQEENEILKRENEELKREKDHLSEINDELNNTNNNLLKIEKDYKNIKSEFSKLLSKFGPNHNSQSIIDIYDETQGKLDKISDLLLLSPESDPINKINYLIQEKNENFEELQKSKKILNYLLNKYETLVHESEKSKRDVLNFISQSNHEKKNQKKNMNIIIILSIIFLVFPFIFYINSIAFY